MKTTLHNNRVALWDIYLDDGTQLTALANFEQQITELQEYISSIKNDISACLMDHNAELFEKIVDHCESVGSDAQVCLNIDWDKIKEEIKVYHKHRIVELLKT